MESQRFDRWTRTLARRRSRRAAITEGGLGVAALAGAAIAGPRPVVAQDATPAPAVTEPASYLFIQSFHSGSFAPDPANPERFTLTLNQGLGYTVYFTERPQRSSGAVPTTQFLQRMDFGEDNPPNAALVVEAGPDDLDIVVVALTNPVYDEPSHTMTYTAEVLSDFEQSYGRQFQERPKTDVAHLSSFGAAQLFIDKAAFLSCCDATFSCISGDDYYGVPKFHGKLGPVPNCGGCSGIYCAPCDFVNAAKLCNDAFPTCNGQCHPAHECSIDLGC